MKNVFLILSLFISSANAETIIYEVNKYGEVQYHKGWYVIDGDKVYKSDYVGNRGKIGILYDKPKGISSTSTKGVSK